MLPAFLAAALTVSPAAVPPSSLATLVHEGHAGAVQVTGTVNAVDVAHRSVNISHGQVRALGWPPMTMDFPVSAGVDLGTLKPGMKIDFTLIHSSNGMLVDTIHPAAAR